ncbi:hypothetical protein K1T71_014603 [Dendrolimus kikuchii]|uniref:Uncharacterized protein n=1 Tax=Dendrolimus kikuchii TaxID=765133 RepID=A0ACC1CEJ9_9NEOP|nr:hypothetical protein K1T71_014603 [Dendrolimus kikuchii]
MEGLNEYTIYGKCRCCLVVGNHRDLNEEYYRNGAREVYFETFINCFNLILSINPNITPLICSTCVYRLQEANNFKTLVINNEKALLNVLSGETPSLGFQCDPLSSFVTVPIETLDSSKSIKSEFDKDLKLEAEPYDDNETDENIDVLVKFERCKDFDIIEGEKELLERFPTKSLKCLPNRENMYKICPRFVWHLDKMKDKAITAQSIEKKFYHKQESHRLTKNRVHITEKLAHAINACTILEHSNAVAFKSKMRSGYPCFYCREIYENMDLLREHQLKHSKENLFKLLTNYRSHCLVVYADVTNLKCVICDSDIKTLKELKCHLKVVHGKRIYEQFTDRVIPFKLVGNSDYECQVCGFNFETFGAVERHMNVHYRNFVCEKCGAGFITNQRLKVHTYTQHKEGTYPCEKCKKTFPTYSKYKVHYDVMHNNKKPNTCGKCSEKFVDYFTKQKHMVEKHGIKPILYKCNVCEKAFTRRYTLSLHLKRCHLDEKDIKCDFCPYMCFTKTELRAHMLKHGAEKSHECIICKKSYARKKTLKEHMRIHTNDRRYVCSVCGQAFIQNCSLKQHLKTHHGEQDFLLNVGV